MENSFQRVGATSNADIGKEFETKVRDFFATIGLSLRPAFPVQIGFSDKKPHKFDLGCENPPTLVECKSYTWTTGGNFPSAKIRSLNETMLMFSVAPNHYRKILFLEKHSRRNVTLAKHYVDTQRHLVGPGVEIWEFDRDEDSGQQVL